MSAVARRYAKALFALAKEGGVLQPTAEELTRVAAVAADATVGPVLRSPLLSLSRRHDLAQTLSRELRLSDLVGRFLRLLADHQRLGELPAIADRYQQLLDIDMGRIRITIQSASPLDAAQEAAIAAAFAKRTGKEVISRVVIDTELLGGILVEAEGKVYDGTVRTQLNRLAKELSGTVSL